MSGFYISFRPAAGQEEALGGLGIRTAGLAEELARTAAQLGRYGGMEALAAALEVLGRQVAGSAQALTGLGRRLGEIQACYSRSEGQILAWLGEIPAQGVQGLPAGGGDGSAGSAPGGKDGNGGSGGVSGPLEETWDWLQEDHTAWDSRTGGEIWGGVLAGSAGISVSSYESEFRSGGEWDSEDGPFAGISGGGTYSILHMDGKGQVGTDWLGLYGEASGDLGVITTTGSVGVFQEDGEFFAGIQGEAGIYAAQGEIGGGINLGFIKIGGTLEGSIGAGVDAELGYDDGTILIGASAAAGIGGGFRLAIDFSPTIDFITSLF